MQALWQSLLPHEECTLERNCTSQACGRGFWCPKCFSKHVKMHIGVKWYNAQNVGKPTVILYPFETMWEQTVERNPVYAGNVGMISGIFNISEDVRKHSREKSMRVRSVESLPHEETYSSFLLKHVRLYIQGDHWSVTTVWKPSVILHPHKATRESTVNTNSMNVTNIEKPFSIEHHCKDIWQNTWKRNSMNVSNVWKPSSAPQTCKHMLKWAV